MNAGNKTIEKKSYKKILSDQRFYLVIIIISLVILASSLNKNFLSISNFLTVFQQISVLGVVTASFSLLLIAGGFDLSIGNIMSFQGSLMAYLAIQKEINIWLTLLIVIIVGVLAGALNGMIISLTKTPPLIITLGTSYVFSGLSLFVSKGRFMSMGGKLDAIGRLKLFGIPVSIFIMLLFMFIAYLILNKFRYGRRIVSLGGNEENAFLSGINTVAYKISVYALNGLFGGFATILLVARLNSITASVGDNYTMQALSAAVMGGVALDGGYGTISGSLLGCILMGIISNAMNVVGINAHLQVIITGLIIVVAVVASNINKFKKSK